MTCSHTPDSLITIRPARARAFEIPTYEHVPAREAIRSSEEKIESFQIEGKHRLYYFPHLNLLTLDAERAKQVRNQQEFTKMLVPFFLGIRKLAALKQAENAPQTLFVEPWKTCNLSCTYCYADAGPAFRNRLGPEQAHTAAKKYPFKQVLVFGGDPLVDARYLQDLYHANNWESFFFSTNGILADRKSSRDLLSLPNVHFQISLEPSEWSYRITADGKKQFDLLTPVLRHLPNRPLNLRLTIPPDAPYIPLKRLIDNITESTGSDQFNISYWPAGGVATAPWITSWLQESYDLLRSDLGGQYRGKLPGFHFMSYFFEMLGKGFRFFNCNAAYGSVAIGPDGKFHGCHELAVAENENDLISSSADSLEIDHNKRLSLVSRWSNNMNNSVCTRCEGRYVCGGICFIEAPPNAACFFLLESLPLVLTQMVQYAPHETMQLASFSEQRLDYLISVQTDLAKEVNSEKWQRLVSGELPQAEAAELAGRFLKS